MENDDAPIGRVLSRREIVALFGVSAASLIGARRLPDVPAVDAEVFAGTPPACVVRPEQMEGPYFVDEKLQRTDIRRDPVKGTMPEGAPLDLELRVTQVKAGTCTPLGGAMIDLWQCDALGVYSDVKDTEGRFDTRGRKFLRGYQVTDAKGTARFHTIFPGWYEGRAVHLHFKVRTPVSGGRHHDFTSQLYFDDAITAEVLKMAPYATKTGNWVRNAQDGIYRSGGTNLMVDLVRRGAGFSGTFDLGFQLA